MKHALAYSGLFRLIPAYSGLFQANCDHDSEPIDRFSAMGTVLDDVTNESVAAQYMCNRIDDWEEYLNGLYSMIGGWLPDGWEAREGAPVLMYEELMHKLSVEPRRMPTLELVGRDGAVAGLAPRGL